jgi:hypothetical protein
VTFSAGNEPYEFNTPTICEFEEKNTPIVRLVMKGLVRKPITIQPPRLSLLHRIQGESLDSSFAVYNYFSHRCSVTSIMADKPWVSINAEHGGHLESNKPWKVAITIDTANLPIGRNEANMRIRIQDQQSGSESVETLPIAISIKPPIEVFPPNLFFGDVLLTDVSSLSKSLTLNIDPRIDVHDDALEITCDNEDLVKLKFRRPQHATSTWVVWAELKSKELSARVRNSESNVAVVDGKVSIRIRGGSFPAIEVPIVARIRRAS